MGARTRSATSSPVKPSLKNSEPQAEQIEPLKLFILPKDTLSDARFVLLQHPRDGSRKRFYFCPEKGLYEFTKIAAPSIDPRSILFTPTEDTGVEDKTENGPEPRMPINTGFGYVNKAAEFFVATPFDIAFLLLPILLPQEAKKSLFQPLDDLLECRLEEDRHLNYMFRHARQLFERAMENICDKVEAGDENMYRLSKEKLLKYLLRKCERVIGSDLPSSLEDKFVIRALDAPVLSIKREETSSTLTATAAGELTDVETDSFDTQSSSVSAAPSTIFSEAASSITDSNFAEDDVTTKIRRLLRLRTVYTFITSSYTPAQTYTRLMSLLESDQSSLDFTPLNKHLEYLAKLRAEAAASRSLGDFSRKRSLEEEDFSETREEKKRKLAEEEKRKKAGESMGVRALKKVDVSGMKKMSNFFTKAAPKAKP